MFGIDPKEIFQQKISDIVVFLFGIHLITVILAYIIKWIRPVLKRQAAVYNNKKSKYPSEQSLGLFNSKLPLKKSNKASICDECEIEIKEDEFLSIFSNLKTIIDIADNPSKVIMDSSNLIKINMMSDSEFENALSLGNFLRKLNKRKCSREAQTNITINPALKLDFSCPEVTCYDLIPERVLKKSDSSDSFLSVSSNNSSADFKKELEQIIYDLESNDESLKERTDDDVIIKKLQQYLKASHAKTDISSSFVHSGNKVYQENKLLETAIAEFEKELKPIKDQIRILKECISGFDLISETRNSIPSDFNSSVSGSGMFSESLSKTTCCSTDLHGYISSYHIISATSVGSFETDSRYKNMKKLDKIASMSCKKNKTHRVSKHSGMKANIKGQEVLDSPEKCKSSKRSPIAEMYVKLSQSNSRSCCVKSKKDKSTSNDNSVTYRIDLNLNLAGVPTSGNQKSKMLKERAIAPLTSDPDDILGKPSTTHISLRPAIK